MEARRIGDACNLYDRHYFKQFPNYLKALTVPGKITTSGMPEWVNTGDYSSANVSYAPIFLRLADQFHDNNSVNYRQWQKIGLDPTGLSNYELRNRMMWYNPELDQAAASATYQKHPGYYARGGEAVITYPNDADNLYLHFTCRSGQTGFHSHPDRNSFTLYHRGNPLLVDQGYSYWKNSEEHNTLLVTPSGRIGTHGQKGGNTIWMDKGCALERPQPGVLPKNGALMTWLIWAKSRSFPPLTP